MIGKYEMARIGQLHSVFSMNAQNSGIEVLRSSTLGVSECLHNQSFRSGYLRSRSRRFVMAVVDDLAKSRIGGRRSRHMSQGSMSLYEADSPVSLDGDRCPVMQPGRRQDRTLSVSVVVLLKAMLYHTMQR